MPRAALKRSLYGAAVRWQRNVVDFFALFRLSEEGHVIGAVDALYLQRLKGKISSHSPAQYPACERVAARYEFRVRKIRALQSLFRYLRLRGLDASAVVI